MYNQAADHYDIGEDKDLAEIYRMKIAMLFVKPHVMVIYGQNNDNSKTVKDEQAANEQSSTRSKRRRSSYM
jgi:hypothetical protein